jgi:RNA polymerase primary sigma factor
MADDNSDTGIKIYLREIGQVPLLTPREEIDLAARIKKGDREARALMIKANLRLVVKIAHDYANLGLPLLDLVSEGNIGLMKAVERFDPAKGGKLSTYAAWWIKQSIKRALANQSKTIRLPVHLVDKISKMRRVSLQMNEELGREPTDDELAEEIGLSSGKVSQLKAASTRPASLDAPISDDDSTEFGEIVGDEDAQTPFELLRDKNLRDEVSDLLEVLDEDNNAHQGSGSQRDYCAGQVGHPIAPATHSPRAVAMTAVRQEGKQMIKGAVVRKEGTSGRPAVLRQAIDALANCGICGIVGAPALGTEASFDVNNVLTTGKSIRGIVAGDSVPDLVIPSLVELYLQGRFPFDRLVKYYTLDQINQAAEDSEKGVTIKPIVRLGS